MKNLAQQLARSILLGFERHFSYFQEISTAARQRFERADWEGVNDANAKRISFYDMRVREAVEKVQSAFQIEPFDEPLWQEVKRCYIELLKRHARPELAETFYNSVFCRLFHRVYFDNDKIFLESSANRQQLVENYRVYMSFHPKHGGLKNCIWEILSSFYFTQPYVDIDRDSARIAEAFAERSEFADLPQEELQIDMLESPFYRNKAAYLIGRVSAGEQTRPFIIPLLNDPDNGLYADTLLTHTKQAKAVFSFARAYFMASTPVPAATVSFLHSIMPDKTEAELYMAIGFHKQAKNEFYRALLRHLKNSDDQFTIAPGTQGLVMQVFTLPSYPVVFKAIRDKFAPQKEVTHDQVKLRYQQVKEHDRVGRMADTLEFSDVALPLDRFSPELLAELQETIPSLLEIEGDNLVFHHLYIEKRLQPLDLVLLDADEEQTREVLDDWGLAIRQLMAANIFPGDLLFKNFGVTRQGKVVFYDYDEICYLTEVNFRRIPPPRTPEDEMSGEPWYSVGPHDVFPEEFPTFLSSDPKIRKILTELHPELWDYRYWQDRQQDIENGLHVDVFPYSQRLRFEQGGDNQYDEPRPKLASV